MDERDRAEVEMNNNGQEEIEKNEVLEGSLNDSIEDSKDLDELKETVEESVETLETSEHTEETSAEACCDEVIEQQKIIDEQNKKIEELEKEYNACKDHLQRLMAEFDNYKKRTAKEKEAIYGNACADIVAELLPVIDNVELAINSMNDTSSVDSIKQGVNMILKQLMGVFGSLGVEEIPALGEKFDHNVHDAIMHVEDENYDENVVVEVIKKGYKIKDKVLRHSMVKVAN